MEKGVEASAEAEISRILHLINFDEVYHDLLNRVKNNYDIIFDSPIAEKIKKLNFNFDVIKKNYFNCYLTKDEQGNILIGDDKFSVDSNIFKLINILTFEHLQSIMGEHITAFCKKKNISNLNYEDKLYFKTYFCKALKHKLNSYHVVKRKWVENLDANLYPYNSVDEYINSCVNSAILTAVFLEVKQSNIYKDYSKINQKNIFIMQ